MKAWLWVLVLPLQAAAPPQYFLTTAAGYSPPISAPIALDQPQIAGRVTYDAQGALYYGAGTHIWRLNADGTDTLIAGSYSSSARFIEGGPAVDAPLASIADFKIDSLGNLYLIDDSTSAIYKVTPDGAIHTFAGGIPNAPKVLPTTGPGIAGTSIALDPIALAIDSDNNVYVLNDYYSAQRGNSIAVPYFVLSFPEDGSSSNLVATVPTFCCYSTLDNIAGLAISGSSLLVSHNNNNPNTLNLKYDDFTINLAGGSGQQATQISIDFGPPLATSPDGSIYGVDGNGRIEKLNLATFQTEVVPNTFWPGYGPGLAVNPITGGLAVAAGTVSVLNPSTGTGPVVACNAPVFSGDGGPALLAVMDPMDLAADAAGDVYLVDSSNNRIRKITPNGIITTIAGNGTGGATGDGGSALDAEISPGALALDGAGNLYFINFSSGVSRTIRKIDKDGIIATVGGGGAGVLTNSAPATSVTISPSVLASDAAGNLYFDGARQIFELNTAGQISLIAGTGSLGGVLSGQAALTSAIGRISSIAVNNTGTVYFGDEDHYVIWEIDSNENLQLVAGQYVSGSFVDTAQSIIAAGAATSTSLYSASLLVFDSQNNLYFIGRAPQGPYQILMVDTSGNLWPTANTGSTYGLGMDGAGNLYTSDGTYINKYSPFNPASPPPYITNGGVVGAGGSVPAVAAISPGGEASIFGANFIAAANAHTVNTSDLVNGKIPTNLVGVCVSIGSMPAAIFGVYPNQINVQVGALPPGGATVEVTVNCGTPQAVTSNLGAVFVEAASPEFYSFLPDPKGGRNPIAAVNATTGALIGPPGLVAGATFVPAKPGDVIQAYATGFGETAPAYGLGVIPGAAGTLTSPYSLTLGGAAIPASDILYAGISPCCAGLYQVDFTVPAGTASGAQPLVITVAGVPSPGAAYIEVQ